MKNMWDERYSAQEYAYGTGPNDFLKKAIEQYNINGRMLFPAEGEGRNAIYAAKNGLKVSAFDLSVEGKKKALKLAKKEQVEIDYQIGDLFSLNIIDHKFDAAAFIYAHLPPALLSSYHKKIGELIVPGGMVLLEGFSKNNLLFREENPNIGGPQKAEMLFTTDSIKSDFTGFEVLQLEEKVVELNEGKFHVGTGSVIRFIGRKV